MVGEAFAAEEVVAAGLTAAALVEVALGADEEDLTEVGLDAALVDAGLVAALVAAAAVPGTHCEYQSFCFWQENPEAQAVSPVQLEPPPHCP